MKRLLIAALATALMLVPATALAKHGRHHHRGHKVHRVGGTVGTITSYDGTTGELVITTVKGRALSGLVTSRTEIECSDESTATASRHGGDDDGDDNGDEPGDDNGDHKEPGDDNGDDANGTCTDADLTAGRTVLRARIDLDGADDAVWTKVKLG